MFTIGELSKLTQLPVKTLRFYHEQGLLVPACVDPDTGYRYYDQRHVETARAIVYLRNLEFPLSDIRQILDSSRDEDFLTILQRQQSVVKERIKALRKAAKSLDQFITEERKARMANTVNEIQEKVLTPFLMGGIRTRGRYSDCGPLFGRLGRSLGRHICGSAMMLHYDREYHEDDADFEACMPVRKAVEVEGIDVRELPGGRCVSLVHRGPYDQLGHSYARVFKYINDHKYEALSPSREVYLKGPG
jgi:DNA-binding transcriptional MerR regulator